MHTYLELEAVLTKVPPGQRDFAASLVTKAKRYAPSEKQAYWINKLTAEALAPAKPAPAVVANVGNLSGILALFETAGRKLKFPVVTLSVPAASMSVRINVAGSNAKFPGSLNVVGSERSETTGRRPWFGRVHKNGNYEAKADAPGAIIGRLQEFAADPAKVAAEYGKLNGVCCFCGLKLGARGTKPSPTALKSLAVGYGKDCAESYGLPWGEVE